MPESQFPTIKRLNLFRFIFTLAFPGINTYNLICKKMIERRKFNVETD